MTHGQTSERANERANGHATLDPSEMKHWMDIRRAVMSITAAVLRAIPNGTHTLDVQIIPREVKPPV